jgi:hypothetical protein
VPYAKDEPIPVIVTTPLARLAATVLESPPPVACPHVTTDPSVLSAAKAVALENI